MKKSNQYLLSRAQQLMKTWEFVNGNQETTSWTKRQIEVINNLLEAQKTILISQFSKNDKL